MSRFMFVALAVVLSLFISEASAIYFTMPAPVATREFTANLFISPAKMSSSTYDDIIGTYQISGDNKTYLNLYRVSGNQILLTSSKSWTNNFKRTASNAVANPLTGKIEIGGYYSPGSGLQPILDTSYYTNGALGGIYGHDLSAFNLPSNSVRFIAMLGSGKLNEDAVPDLAVLFLEQGNSGSTYRLCVEESNGMNPCTSIATLYWDRLTVGKFFQSNTDQMVLSGPFESNNERILLYTLSQDSFSLISNQAVVKPDGYNVTSSASAKADIDGDGIDELLVGGSYRKSSSVYSDFVQAYKYSGSGQPGMSTFLLSAMRTNTTSSNSAFSNFLGGLDVDSDGKQEIVSINIESGSGSMQTMHVSTLKYTGSGTLALLNSRRLQASNPSSSNYYQFHSAAVGKFGPANTPMLAIVYKDVGASINRMDIFNISVASAAPADTTVPVLGMTTDKQIYASGQTMHITVNVSDNAAIGNPAVVDNSLVKIKYTYSNLSVPYSSEFFATETAPGSLVFTADATLAGAPDGTYGLSAQATDAAGNTGYRNMNFVVNSTVPVDSTAPVLGMTTDKQIYASGQTVHVSVTVSDNAAIGNPAQFDDGLVKVKFSNMGYSSPTYNPGETSPNSLVFNTTMSLVGVPDGVYGLSANATDASGNTGYRNMNFWVNSTAVVNDVTPPVITATLDKAVYANSQSLLVSVSATDDVGIGNPAELEVNLMKLQLSGPNDFMSPVFYAVETAPDSNQFSYTFPLAGLPDGAYMLSAYASDHEGNTGYGDVNFNINSAAAADSQAPTVVLVSPLEGSVHAATGELDAKFIATDNVAITSATMLLGKAGGSYSSGYQVAVLANDGFYHNSFNLALLTPGEYTMSATVADAAGNSQTDANVFNVTGLLPQQVTDIKPPTVKVSLDYASREQGATPLKVTIWAVDNGMVDSSTVKATLVGTGGYTTGYFAAAPQGGNTYTVVMDTSLLPAGSYKVVGSATDNAGNVGTDAVGFIVSPSGSQPVPPVPSSGSAAEIDRRIAVLEVKINYASSQGADMSAATGKLSNARAYRSQEKFTEAATELDKGEILVDYAMSKANSSDNLPPVSPYGGRYFPCLPVPGLIFLVFLAAGMGAMRKKD